MPWRVKSDLNEAEISHLLSKQSLSSVKVVERFSFYTDEPHVHCMYGALFARICTEATALQTVRT